MSAMPLRVLFLGPLREQVGRERAEVACPPDGAQRAFWKSLLVEFPALENRTGSLRLARNNQFLQPFDALKPGDEIALIPPVSGG